MTFALIGLVLVAALALSGWVMAELELRDAHAELDDLDQALAETRRDRDIAEAYAERDLVTAVDPHPVLHLIEGGDR